MPQKVRQFKTAMVIDDSIVQRHHAVKICESLGIRIVDQANNGQEALDHIARRSELPQLLIVDLEMPIMDGVAFIQKLADANLPVSIVILSSREFSLISSVETMVKAYGLPVVGALKKPLKAEQFQQILTKYAERPATLPPLLNQQHQTLVSVTEIATAIHERQFIPYFQPKIMLATGMMKGVETLLRWQHPSKGMIYPNDFIPQAEEHGLIHELTIQVIGMTLVWLQFWQARGLNFNAAINLSALSLSDEHLVEQIYRRVIEHGIAPQQITIEITESAVMADVAQSLNSLARLRLKGFGLSIDDYGTGFSSMQQLARIPFTELKIDRSFVDGASDNIQLENMVSIAIDTARRLELSCVAEGVETLADWLLLKRLGCDIAQGYFAAKPMPGEEIVDWIKNNSARLREL